MTKRYLSREDRRDLYELDKAGMPPKLIAAAFGIRLPMVYYHRTGIKNKLEMGQDPFEGVGRGFRKDDR